MKTLSPTRGDAKEIFTTGPGSTAASFLLEASLNARRVLNAPPRLEIAKKA